jgi:hypothetical protein
LPPLEPADLLNGYLGTNVAYALEEIGIFEAFETQEILSDPDLSLLVGGDTRFLAPILRAAELLGYVSRADGGLRLTAAGRSLLLARGYVTWTVGAYGEMLRHLAELARRERAFAVNLFRDEAKVAVGTDSMARSAMTPVVDAVLDDLCFEIVADLGSGNAGRLVHICRRYPGVSGLAIDISAEACALATEEIAAAGMDDRIDVICADAIDVVHAREHRRLLDSVDTVTSFFMLHELLALRPDLDVLERLRAGFPNAHQYVIAETTAMDEADQSRPLFCIAYETVHALMGISIPSREFFENLFGRVGMRIERRVELGLAPYTWLYVLSAS